MPWWPKTSRQAHDLWHVRESIPLAQAEEGLTSSTISPSNLRDSAFVEHADALCSARFPACAWSTLVTWAMATCTTTCKYPKGPGRQSLPHDKEPCVNALGVIHAVAQFGGSFSPSMVWASSRPPSWQKYESPVALALMRAIKQALDPQNIMNPGCMLKA